MDNSPIKEENKESSQFISTWREHVEIVTKVGVVALGIAYITGLLILNLHIRKYGVNYLSFLQIEYVTVGILWSFLVGFMTCTLLLLRYFWGELNKSDQGNSGRVRRIVINVMIILSLIVAICAVLQSIILVLSDYQITFLKLSFWLVIGVLLINAFAILLLSGKLRDATKRFFSIEKTEENRTSTALVKAIGGFYYFTVLLTAISMYSSYTFPKLSPVFGGGMKQQAEFVIKAEQKETINAIGLEVLPNSRRVGPFEVIFEASEFFLLAPPPGFSNTKVKAIRLKKDLIDAALYIDER